MSSEYITRLPAIQLTKVDNVIIDFSFLFRLMTRAVWYQQENIFGKDMSNGYHKAYKVILLNNFYVCVDTCLRSIAITKKLIAHLKSKFEIGKFYIIFDDVRIPSWRCICPNAMHKVFMKRYELCKECKERLMDFSKYIPDVEVEEYLPYENVLITMSGAGGYTPLRHKDTLYTYDKHDMIVAKNKFFYLMQLLQSEITLNEWKFIYDLVSEQVAGLAAKSPNVVVLCNSKPLMKGYAAAELALALAIDRKETSLLLSDRFLPNDHVFIMELYTEKYHRTTDYRSKSKLHNIPLFDRYEKPKKSKTLDDLFELCNKEFHDKLLTTDPYNIHNVFISPTVLYVKNKRPKELEDLGRTYTNIPLDKSTVIDIMHKFIPEYNKVFDSDLRVV